MANNIFTYYSVNVRSSEDVSGDEPRLVLAFVTISANETAGVEVDVIDTGQLGSGLDNEAIVSGRVSSTNAPTIEAPFFALVAVAIDNDKSFNSHRSNHATRFGEAVEQAFNNIHNRPGGFPQMDTANFAGRLPENWRDILRTIRDEARVEIQRNWLIRDRDDIIGAPSVSIFSNLGNEFHTSGLASDGHTFNFRKRFLTIFGEDGVVYNVNFTLTANIL